MMSLVNVSLKLGIYGNIFAEKMWVAFALTFFQQKYLCVLHVDIVLTRTVNILMSSLS